MRILVFGDSIAQGFWDSEGGWVHRLRKKYDALLIDGKENDPPIIFNLGISGDTSNDVLVRFDNEVLVRNFDEVAIVFAVGVNDATIREGIVSSDIANYEKNLSDLLSKARAYSDKILFVGLTPCVEELSNPVAWGDIVYTNERIKQFDTTLHSFCDENKVGLVQVFETFQEALKEQELLPDGIHPNDAGHQLIADIVGPRIDALLKMEG